MRSKLLNKLFFVMCVFLLGTAILGTTSQMAQAQSPSVFPGDAGTYGSSPDMWREIKKGKLVGAGKELKLDADQVFMAIGQVLDADDLGSGKKAPKLGRGRIQTDEEGRTSLQDVWAGGDCTDQGDDLTVTAVAQGRDAAESIHRALQA